MTLTKSKQRLKNWDLIHLFFKKDEIDTTWNYYVTYVDEFVQRKIIQKDKLDLFKESYKDPEEFSCLFVIDGDFTNFIYIPYPED